MNTLPVELLHELCLHTCTSGLFSLKRTNILLHEIVRSSSDANTRTQTFLSLMDNQRRTFDSMADIIGLGFDEPLARMAVQCARNFYARSEIPEFDVALVFTLAYLGHDHLAELLVDSRAAAFGSESNFLRREIRRAHHATGRNTALAIPNTSVYAWREDLDACCSGGTVNSVALCLRGVPESVSKSSCEFVHGMFVRAVAGGNSPVASFVMQGHVCVGFTSSFYIYRANQLAEAFGDRPWWQKSLRTREEAVRLIGILRSESSLGLSPEEIAVAASTSHVALSCVAELLPVDWSVVLSVKSPVTECATLLFHGAVPWQVCVSTFCKETLLNVMDWSELMARTIRDERGSPECVLWARFIGYLYETGRARPEDVLSYIFSITAENSGTLNTSLIIAAINAADTSSLMVMSERLLKTAVCCTSKKMVHVLMDRNVLPPTAMDYYRKTWSKHT